MESIRTLSCKKLRYVWDEEEGVFVKLGGLERGLLASALHRLDGLGSYERHMRRSVYGDNEMLIPIESVPALFLRELSSPFYVFQIFSFCLWIADVYMYYAIAILAMTFVSVSMDVCQTRKVRDQQTQG